MNAPPFHLLEKLAKRPPLVPVMPEEPVFPLSVKAYHALVNAGVYGEDDAIEFLEGWLVPKMPRKPSHSATTRKLRELLRRLIPAGYFVDSQEAVTTRDSEPEPDVYVVRGNMDDFDVRHPQPTETPLVCEVADSTLVRDRGVKQRIYARGGVPVYWIVNLPEQMVEVHSDPARTGKPPRYRDRQNFSVDDKIPVVLDGREVGRLAVRDFLPKSKVRRN